MEKTIKKHKAIFWFTWAENLEYRSHTIIWALTDCIPFFIMFFLWNFIYQKNVEFVGFSLNMMVTYYLLSYLVGRLSTAHVDFSLSDGIKNGTFVQFLIRPINHRLVYLFKNLAMKSFQIAATLPILLIIFLLFNKYLLFPPANVLPFFLIAIILSFGINFFLSFIVGYSAFWLESADSVIYFKWAIVYYLSGRLLPFDLFGDPWSEILKKLPFRYALSFPIEIYLEQIPKSQIYMEFFVGLFWLAIIYIISVYMFNKGLKKFSMVGN